MASPFSIFRKKQKMMMVVLIFVAMFGFVILPSVLEIMGGRPQTNPVVIQTRQFGDLRRSDLENIRRTRGRILGVLAQLQARGELNKAIATGQIAPEMAKALQERSVAYARQYVEQVFGPATYESVAQMWLLANQAKQVGMVAGDDVIRDFIQGITRNSLSSADILKVLRQADLSERMFFQFLREEMLALQFTEEFRYSTLATTPGQRWNYFNRINRMATIQVLPVAVTDFINEVEDPTDEELKAFFKANCKRRPNPVSPQPGFRQPHEIALQYFQADIDQFAKDVTDEDIQAYYEKHKEVINQEIEREKSFEQKKAELAELKAKIEEAKAKDKKNEEKKAEDKKAEAATTEKQPETKADAPTDTKPVERVVKKPVQEAPQPTENQPTGEQQENQPEKNDAGSPPSNPPTQGDEGKTTVVLSESMKDRLRRDVAQERIRKVFDQLQVPMGEYFTKWSRYDVQRIKNQSKKAEGNKAPELTPPTPLDFEALAKLHGLTTASTKLIPQWEAQNLPIGQSYVDGRSYVWLDAYQSLAKFRPMVSEGADSMYLFWKSDDVEDHVPEFKDQGVREKVLHAWKMIQARELAMKQAKALADEATQAQQTLKQAFADQQKWIVISPPKFSWLTFGSAASFERMPRPRLSEVTGVPMAGEEFMQAVFGLENPGQVAVAFNAPQTVAYVVQLDEFSPVFETRMAVFEEENYSKYASVALGDRIEMNDAWLKEIKKAAGFEWMPGFAPEQLEDVEQPSEEE